MEQSNAIFYGLIQYNVISYHNIKSRNFPPGTSSFFVNYLERYSFGCTSFRIRMATEKIYDDFTHRSKPDLKSYEAEKSMTYVLRGSFSTFPKIRTVLSFYVQ